MTGRTIFTLLVSLKVMLRKVYALSRRLKGDLNAQRLVKEDECLRQSEWCAMCYAAPPLTRVTVSSSRNAKNNRGEERPSLSLSFLACAFLLVSHYGDEVAAAIPLFSDRSVDGMEQKDGLTCRPKSCRGFHCFPFQEGNLTSYNRMS